MLFSANWLSRYVDLPASIDELADLLTQCGMVVDDMRSRGSDTVFDLDIPSNRVDAMNHLGVAREIATARRIDLRLPSASVAASNPTAADLASVQIDDLDGCPRYAARVVEGVQIARSPSWMAELLDAIGLRPLNNVADITNFVLWECGHPLHAFDHDKLSERRIVVRRAAPGETLRTLDEIDRELVVDDLVIADAERPVALAGIMGGADTAISESSTNVLLEGAWFEPGLVRASAQRLNLHTDASHRFERSPARDGMLASLDRAAALIAELAGGRVAEGTIDIVGDSPEPTSTTLRMERLHGLLGVEIETERVRDILDRLGFEVAEDGGSFRVGVPSCRPDVSREEDLIEEVGRHYGYDNLPATLPEIRSSEEPGTPDVLAERRLKRCFAAAGFREAMASSLSSDPEQSLFLDDGQQTVTIGNPISESLGVLRAHLAPGLLSVAAHNVNRGQNDLRLFEVGHCFLGPLAAAGVLERWSLGIALAGRRRPGSWDEPSELGDLFDLKGVIEAVTRQMAWPAWEWQAGTHHGVEPATSARLAARDEAGEIIATGWAGRASLEAADHFDLAVDVWLAELDIDALLPRLHPTARFEPVSRFPDGVRDLAIVLSRDISYERVRVTVRETTSADDLPLAALELVEIYEGSEIPSDQRSLTLRFTYRADDRTLTADEIDGAHGVLTEALTSRLDARQR